MKTVDFSNRKHRWTLALFLYAGMGAMVFQMRGALLVDIKETFSVSESVLGLVTPAGTVGFTIAALTTGMIAGKIPLKKAMLIGVGLTALSTMLIGFSPFYLLFLGTMALRGITAGIPGGIARPLLGHLHPEQRGRIFNIDTAIWAGGAALGPLFATLVVSFTDWRNAYLIMGFLFIPALLLMIKTDLPLDKMQEESLSFAKLRRIIKDPRIIVMAAGMFLSVGVEGGFFTWLPYYLTEASFSKNAANLTFSGYLAAYIPGRLFNGWLVEKFTYTTLIMVNSICVILCLVVAFVLSSGYLTILAVVATGFFLSTIWPNLFALGIHSFPQHSGPVNGIVMTFDPLGISVFPALIGIIADKYTIGLGMQTLVLLMAALLIMVFLLRKATANARHV
ncbi:MAG: MFS transporter [Candidatus Bipolaricaulota bacterium]